MLRVHCVQLFYSSVRWFVGLRLSDALPDETTILHFRHLLEEHGLGVELLEEINRLPATEGGAGRGANLGWSDYEGSAPFWSNTEPPGHVRPTVEYRHGVDSRCSVTGGYVYRGQDHPALQGIYFFADYVTGNIWGLKQVNGVWESELLLDSPYNVSSFGEDEDGNLYLLHYSGTIFQVQAAGRN